jgi:TonB-linked SusC/RagA family outer membrane protein
MRKLLLSLTALLFCIGSLLAQKVISGKVTDNQGNPLPNVSVVIKGTSSGTTTKADGTYSINFPANATVLVFSSVGMAEQEVRVGTNSVINANMISEAQDLGEVVVTVPYGTIKKSAFTGSESTISSKSIERQQVTNITKALEGLAPGIIATSGTGSPGSGTTILLRGIGSFAANASPLYVLDGAPYFGDIAALSTDDVESVTLLKDAAASALFGSRGANGVIMITTKRGKKGRSTVTATVRRGYMMRGIPEYDRVAQQEYYELNWESIRNKYYAAGQTMTAAGAQASAEVAGPNGLVYNAYNVPANQLVDPVTGKLNSAATLKWTDYWEDELFRNAPRTNATVNISGGSERSDYSLTLGYLDEQGTVKNSYYKRYNTRLNMNTAATSWLNAGTSIDATFSKQNFLIGENGGTAGSNPFFFSRTMGPIYPVYEYDPVTGAPVIDPLNGLQKLDWGGSILNANGVNVGSLMGTRPYLGIVNPLGQLTLDDNSTNTIIANANTYLEVKFTPTLTLKTTLIANIWDDRTTGYQNNQYGDAASNGGRSTKTSDRQFTLTMNEVLTWAKAFDKHNIRAIVGHENFRYQFNRVQANKTGFIIPGMTELDNGTEIFGQPSSFEDNHRLESYFASVNYDFDRKYLLSASFRTDGSSRFSDDTRWGNFYSAGIGWRISQESFMQSVRWIDELKFKASYGEMGNEDLGALYYPYRLYYPADGNGAYIPPTRAANPGLKWEGNKSLNIGFDYSFLKNRLQGSIEWYKRISDDLLFFTPMPISTGFIDRPENVGTFENTGIDFQLGYNAIRKSDFDWRVDLNLTHFKNKVTKLPAIQVRNSEGVLNGNFKLKEGQDMFRFYLREFAGVDASTGEAMYYKNVLGTDGKPTGERVLTNNIAQASGSEKFFGSSLPDFSGGLNNSFRYKNFDLSILLTFSYGGLYYDGNYNALMHTGAFGNAWHTDIRKRWQKPGDVTNVPKIQNGTQATQDGVSSRFLFDRSYLNIKNITFSYSFGSSLAKRLDISDVKFFINVDNAYLFSAQKGMNPQSNVGGTSNQGYPIFRTLTGGITVSL